MLLLTLALAAAQSVAEGSAPSAQNLRLSVDGRAFWSTDLSGVRGGQAGSLRAVAGYAARPLERVVAGSNRVLAAFAE
ncbi:MAG TPA: hypothetical protein PKA64_24775, partial [Myxococcota bacterium]|nr:hypothetical protein [Myxococcota bacterium]